MKARHTAGSAQGDRERKHPFPVQQPVEWEVPAFKINELSRKMTRYCVGIPVINEGERIGKQLRSMQKLNLHQLIDIVIADGGSTDGSLIPEQLAQLGVRTLLTKTGPGHMSAQLRMFFSYALCQGYDGFIIIDGNNKDGVEAMPDFINALDDGWREVRCAEPKIIPPPISASRHPAMGNGLRIFNSTTMLKRVEAYLNHVGAGRI